MPTEQNIVPFEDIQTYRDNYIRELDKRVNKTEFAINNAESLYALGLTMYSKEYSFDSLVYSAFATSALDENIALHPEQRKIMSLIHANRGLIFSAPTSFGKTFVVFEYICRVRPKNVVMIVPTLALIDEYKQKIIRQYRDKFSDYNIYLSIDPDKTYDFSKKNIFIVTHDRVIDESTVAIFDAIDFLVIDEVYKLQKDASNERILILNIAYYNMVKRSKKYVLLAPFISGVENLEKLDDVPVFYATNYAPVVNDVKVINILSENDRVAYADKTLEAIPQSDNTLIYFPTVVEIDAFIENTSIDYDSLTLDDNPVLNEFITWGRREIHPQWSVIKALEKGFLVHHGQLPLGIRMLELGLFNNKHSSFTRLICTSTLLEGVNTTAKNIIITKPYRSYDKTFDAFDFYNLVGRTGRLYQHYLGMAYYIRTPNDPIYEKAQAIRSIEFELTDSSIDMDINFGDYTTHPEFLEVLNSLGITYEEYRSLIARKHRFSTVQFLLGTYTKFKEKLFDVLYRQTVDPNQSKLELIRVLCEILGMRTYGFKMNTFIINRLTYKYRQTVRDVVDATLKSYPTANLSKLINTVIRYKSSYIEFDFYSKVDLIRYFMQCEHISEVLISTLHDRVMKNIEVLYYLNSPSKKMLKDMGIYEGDIDQIIKIIGNDFSTVAELEQLLARNYQRLSEISVISKYIILRLIN
ncbi:DEAD/DEAH box helicase [Allofournierella sp.]|uniref:DEAD/DEAH box helicase n=1 Tax=Allofournierella sp. TaxID=1940256 RepID=UPI003AB8EB8E